MSTRHEARPEPAYIVTADYVISKNDAGEVSARSGRSGAIVACDKDASSVIQKVIDDLPAEGGKLFISAGCYWLNSTVTIEDKHAVHLEGAARGIGHGQKGTILRSDQNINLLEIFGNKKKLAGITISNLYLVGSGKENGKAGILVRGSCDLLSLHNVGANHCGIGFHFLGGGGNASGVIDAPQIQFCDPQVNGIGLKIERCHYAKVIGGEFSDCSEYGIMLSSPETGYERIQGIKISSVTGVRNGKAGIFIGRNTDCITVTGGSDFGGTHSGSGVVISDEGAGQKPRNIIVSGVHAYNNRDTGILVQQAQHVIISECICSAHAHVSVENYGQKKGIHIESDAEDVIVQANIIYGNREQAILDDTGQAVIANNSDKKQLS